MIRRGAGPAALKANKKNSLARPGPFCRSRFVASLWGILWSIALLAASNPALAFVLGEMESLSALGQPFRARVGFQLAPGESIDAACIRVRGDRPEATADLPVLLGARLRIDSIAGKGYIFVESAEAPAEPIQLLQLNVHCNNTGSVTRQYVLLLNPPDVFAEAAVAGTIPAVQPPAANARLPKSSVVALAPPQVAPSSGASPPDAAKRSPSQSARRQARKPKTRTTQDVLRLAPAMDALRIAPALSELETASAVPEHGWRLRLSYEMIEREGAPISEAERESLRREFAERMAEDDVVPRLMAMRDEVQTLKRRVAGLIGERAAAETRRKSEEESERYAWMAFGVLGAISLAAGAGLWLWRRRRAPFNLGPYTTTVRLDEGTNP